MALFQSTAEDLRFAFRMMKRSPGLTAVAVVSLALGMGATIAIFSVIYALALRRLPVERPEELVEVARGGIWNVHSYAEWKLFRDRQNIFSGVLAYNYFDSHFQIGDSPGGQDETGLYVSGDYFKTLGVRAVLGRVLQSSDDQPGAPPACVLGYGLWRRMYGQSPAVLGARIRVDGNEYAIVGVAPESFAGVEIGGIPEIFMPLEAERTYRDYPLLYGKQTPSLDSPATLLSFAGRLKPGMSVSEANAGLQLLAPQINKVLALEPEVSGRRQAVLTSLVAHPIPNGMSDTWLQSMDILLLLITMASAALIIVCANLGNLLLARGTKRRSEIATRLALGASRGRLVRQMLTESVALSVGGAAAGLFVARAGTRVLLWALSFPGAPIVLDLSWDAKLAVFAAGIIIASTLLFGLVPAMETTQLSVYSAMNNGSATGRRRNRLMNSSLVAVQVGLSVTLLVSAGLLARTLQALLAQDPGYDAKGVLLARANWQGARENAQREALAGKQLRTAIRSLPGVTSVSLTRASSKMTLSQLSVAGPNGAERKVGSYLIFVSPSFFNTRRAPMMAGRDFTEGDTEASIPVAILSEDLAKMLFGTVNAVGMRFRENDGAPNGPGDTVDVIGISKDMQYRRPSDGPLPILYRPVSQCAGACSGVGTFEVRSAGAFAETAKRLEKAAADVDPRLTLKCAPLSEETTSVIHRNRAVAWIATVFGLFVGLLASIGVYGVTSHATAERTREIGVRMALGAQRSDVFRMLFSEVMRVVGIGIVFGAGTAALSARMLSSLIWGVTPADPPSFGFAICLMLMIAGIAGMMPARRAMRVDPIVSLRYE